MKNREPIFASVLLLITAVSGNAFSQGTGLFSWATQPQASVTADTIEDGSLTFRAYVTETDQVGIMSGFFYYVHQETGEEFPITINGEPRDIEWQQSTGLVDFGESIPLSGDLYYTLEIIEGRELTSLTNVPTSAEGVAVILMDDSQFEEGAWYEWRLHWSESPPRPVEEDQIYWAGYLHDAEGVLVQIQGGQLGPLDFGSIGNAALVFGSNLPAYPVDIAVLESGGGVLVSILEQPSPWNGYRCFVSLKPPTGAPSNTPYSLLIGWGEEVDPGPQPTPGPLPVADTENINTAAYFPDLQFRLAVQRKLDVSFSDEFTPEDARAFQGALELSNQGIQNVTGLAFLENITGLSCNGNRIADLDIAGLSSLVSLAVSDNRLSELDVSGNPELQYLDVSQGQYSFNPTPDGVEEQRNHLQHLDVSNNPQLIELLCDGNDLAELDIASNPKLVTLSCQQNRLSSLDLSQNPALKSLNISNFENYFGGNPDSQSGNQFKRLDVTNNPELEFLGLWNSRYFFYYDSTNEYVP